MPPGPEKGRPRLEVLSRRPGDLPDIDDVPGRGRSGCARACTGSRSLGPGSRCGSTSPAPGPGVARGHEDRDVGVDIERVERRRGSGPIADLLFGPIGGCRASVARRTRRTAVLRAVDAERRRTRRRSGSGNGVPFDLLRPSRGLVRPSTFRSAAVRAERSACTAAGCASACSHDDCRGRHGFDRVPRTQGRAEPRRRRGAPRRPCARHHAARSLPPVRPAADGGGDGRLPGARPPTRHARAARVHPRRVGLPAADAEGRLARAHPAAGDGDRRRALPRAPRRRRRLRRCSMSAPARARSRSRSRTSGRRRA